MKLSELQEVLDFAEQFSDNFNMEQKELVLEILTENEKPIEEKPAKRKPVKKKAKEKTKKKFIKITESGLLKVKNLRASGASYSEISKATGIPQGSLGHAIKRAKAL